MKRTNLLITGATGSVGTQLVNKLVNMNVSFRALVRNNDQGDLMAHLPQTEIAVGDLSDSDSLVQALQGIEKAFLLTNSSEQAEELQLNFVNAAYKAGVKHIVKLSQLAANENSPVRFLRYHAVVENRIKELGMNYTFLRPNLFMQGLIAFGHSIKYEGKFYGSLGNAAVSAVDIRDIAGVAAKVLTENGHENKIYNITGEESLTHFQMAEILSRILKTEISYIDLNSEQMHGALTVAGFPEWQIGGLIEDYAHYARGEASEISNTVHHITGKPAIGFEQFVHDHLKFFK
ncbi:MAG: NAD(P)-dependent oxidoreductase [Chryseobacterium sp.]|uniref:SDR family oxidoreductase n=1 Tax=Chryseobacterium sp. Y16C TaxID=2920939 RepID=UPI000DB81E92|nr:SDR family oxidoreductase [Chryseobacterium sp. Y16C]PZU04797.1 MAG: NAD(P)-dependent oxidoreductase [Chryseobacterium sp.]UMQ42280.1 SDR family oxidoreductase [Chryseobacterium sp. Y16C]